MFFIITISMNNMIRMKNMARMKAIISLVMLDYAANASVHQQHTS
jgi:hypothetical protein